MLKRCPRDFRELAELKTPEKTLAEKDSYAVFLQLPQQGDGSRPTAELINLRKPIDWEDLEVAFKRRFSLII